MTPELYVKYIHRMTNPLIENFRRFTAAEIDPIETPSRNFINTIVETFLSRYADELFPDPYFYMVGPVTSIEGEIIEASSVKLKTDYRFNILRDFGDEIADGEKINQFKEALATELRELIAHHENQGQIVCPYMLTTSGWLIDPTGLPTIKFMFRYGKTEKLPRYGDIEQNGKVAALFENSKRIMTNLCNFAGKHYIETLPEYKNFVRGFLNRYGDAILAYGVAQPYLTDDVEIVKLKTTVNVHSEMAISSLRHLIKSGIYEDLYEEIDCLQGKLGKTGHQMAVYAPLICSGVMIDLNTFEPTLTFSTAFARTERTA